MMISFGYDFYAKFYYYYLKIIWASLLPLSRFILNIAPLIEEYELFKAIILDNTIEFSAIIIDPLSKLFSDLYPIVV